MNAARPPGPPTFRTALINTGKDRGALPPRRVGKALLASLLAHALLGLGLVVSALLTFGPIAPPPIPVRFFATVPAAPKLAPLREKSEPLRIEPKPPVLARREAPAPIPPLVVPPPPRPAATPRPRVDPPPLKVETAGLPIRMVESAPQLRVRDAAPPTPRSATPSLGNVNAQPAIPSGSGPEPDLVFLRPGRERPRGAGGGVAGTGDGLPSLPGTGSTGRTASSGGGTPSGGSRGPELGTERTFTTIDGGAAALGRRYGAALIEAARLGQRTSDGARYSLLVPGLSEAYRQVALRGTWRAAQKEAGGLASAQVDHDAIAIRYDDGTLHVVVPTGDGLVALYVSAGGGTGAPRSKVGEAERALRALQRLAQIRGS